MNQNNDHASVDPKVAADRQLLIDAQAKGTGAKFGAYFKLSGPGWLQSAITLGGGSLAGSLYLGVIGGYELMWLQPIMMILGIVMLSAIAYVTLSTGERPFKAINEHVNPVLGWGWLIAAMMANLVWAMPQFSLGTAALQQNLFPDTLDTENGKYLCIAMLFIVASVIIWFYDSGGWGVKVFEIVLKLMVAVVVLSFFGAVIAMSMNGQLDWGLIFSGFIPNFSLFSEPTSEFGAILEKSTNADYWKSIIINVQRDNMITAAATAVGINMTFLLPYSMLRKGWDKNFRGLATFDLSTGLFIPFLLATSCVVISAASQFHGKYDEGLIDTASRTKYTLKVEGSYKGNALGLLKKNNLITKEALAAQATHDKAIKDAFNALMKTDPKLAKATQIKDPYIGLGPGPVDQARNALPEQDRKIAAMLVKRDAYALAGSLGKLTGESFAQTIFGIGVLGMAISTIIILMLINGFTTCEMLNVPSKGKMHRIGSILPGITGALGFIWLWSNAESKFWLAVPTSVFGMVLLPIAYITFFFMMNNKSLMGQHLLAGGKRTAMNIAMLIAIVAASIGAGWSIWSKAGWYGIAAVAIFVGLAIIVHFIRPPKKAT